MNSEFVLYCLLIIWITWGPWCLGFSICKMGHNGDNDDDDNNRIYNFSEEGSKNQLRGWMLNDFA